MSALSLQLHTALPRRKLLLVVMDGVGIGPGDAYDAVHVAKTPFIDSMCADAKHFRSVCAHGTAVGLPTDADMGNSEVGHNALGSGRVALQGASLVDDAIKTGEIFTSDGYRYLHGAFSQPGRTLHLIGLLSDGGVHSRDNQLYEIINHASSNGAKRIRLKRTRVWEIRRGSEEMSFKPKIIVCSSPAELSGVACKKIVEIIHASERTNWPLSIALSGGSTPKMLYSLLHEEHLHLLKEERALRFFFGDERLVPADAAESNYNMARQALLHDIPEDLVVPVDVGCVGKVSKVDCNDAVKSADAYEKRIALLLGTQKVEGMEAEIPVFDIVLLGLGSDGHTASIFHGSQAESETHRAVSVGFPSPTMSPKVWRVTLTPEFVSRENVTIRHQV